jgi:hypothetical protein
MFFTKTRWKKANLSGGYGSFDSETIVKILESGYVNTDEVELFMDSIQSSIMYRDDNLFDYLINYAPDEIIFNGDSSEITLGQYIQNKLTDYLKLAIHTLNLHVVEYALRKLDKSTVTDLYFWGENLTMLNYALYVQCHQSMPGKRIHNWSVSSDKWEELGIEWIIKTRAKLLLYIIN